MDGGLAVARSGFLAGKEAAMNGESKPGVMVVGLGFTGKRIARMLLEREENVVAVVDLRLSAHPQNQGKTLVEVLRQAGEASEELPDAPLVATIEEALGLGAVRAAIVSTASELEAVADVAESLLSAGVNVLTTSELALDPLYPTQDKMLAKRIDAAARKGGATFFAGGVQDVLWASLAGVLSGGCARIDRVYGKGCAVLDNLGPRCLDAALVGQPLSVFEGLETDNEVMTQALCVLARLFELEVSSASTMVSPCVARQDITLPSGRVVPEGSASGTVFKSVVSTREGVVLAADFTEKVSEPGEQPSVYWRLEGEPTFEVTVADAWGDDTTCAAIVNRVADVIDAEPGYLSVADMPLVHWRAH